MREEETAVYALPPSFIPLLLSRFPGKSERIRGPDVLEVDRGIGDGVERTKKKQRHYAIYVYTLRHAMICQRPEAKNTRPTRVTLSRARVCLRWRGGVVGVQGVEVSSIRVSKSITRQPRQRRPCLLRSRAPHTARAVGDELIRLGFFFFLRVFFFCFVFALRFPFCRSPLFSLSTTLRGGHMGPRPPPAARFSKAIS